MALGCQSWRNGRICCRRRAQSGLRRHVLGIGGGRVGVVWTRGIEGGLGTWTEGAGEDRVGRGEGLGGGLAGGGGCGVWERVLEGLSVGREGGADDVGGGRVSGEAGADGGLRNGDGTDRFRGGFLG